MASINIYLICFLVFYVCDSTHARLCGSCMTIAECPEAVSFYYKEMNNNQYLLSRMKQATCGVLTEGGKLKPTICCEDFINPLLERIDTDQDTFETHKNFELLPKTCGRSNGQRIIGGEIANMYEIPWMALLATRENKKVIFYCGGSIINEKYVLTAAHCLDETTVYAVRIGEYNINTREDCFGDEYGRVCEKHLQDIRIKEIIIHENFTRNPSITLLTSTMSKNDIALLRLKKKIDFNHKNAEPVCLPVFPNLINMDLTLRTATASGWGVTEFKRRSSTLMKVKIPISSNYECAQRTQSDENDIKVLCAGGPGNDTCRGDSGGPLVIEEEYNGTLRNIQFGLVSYGPRECGSGVLGVYTDIRKYMKWILDNIRK